MKQVKQRGCVYVDVFYPGYIALVEGFTGITKIEEKVASILLLRHLTPLEILDFNNGVEERQIEVGKKKTHIKKPINEISEKNLLIEFSSSVAKVIDYSTHEHAVFTPRYYSELIIAYEIDDVDEKQVNLNFAERVLDYFISSYRFITKDVRVKRPSDLDDDNYVLKTCIFPYSEDDLKLRVEERLTKQRSLSFGIKQLKFEKYQGSIPQKNEEIEAKFSDMTLGFLLSNVQISPAGDLILKALEDFRVNKNYKYALLNAFTAAETIISGYVDEEKIKRGVSKKKLDDYKSQVGIGYALNVELPLIIDKLSEGDRQILGNIDKVRKKRNDVIHNGAYVSFEEAEFAVNSVFKLLSFLDEKKYKTGENSESKKPTSQPS